MCCGWISNLFSTTSQTLDSEQEPLLPENSLLLFNTASQIIDLTRLRMIDRLPIQVKLEIRKSYLGINWILEPIKVEWDMPQPLSNTRDISFNLDNIIA